MDDDRLDRARMGDLEACPGLLLDRAPRLLRLATVAAGDPAVAAEAVRAAARAVWRDFSRVGDAADLDVRLERALVASLPRRLRAGGPPPDGAPRLAEALAHLRPAERVTLARCADPDPGAAALALAGRLGVEVDYGTCLPPGDGAGAGGDIVDLAGPLAGWDLAHLRAALADTAGRPDPGAVAAIAADLAGRRPDSPRRARLRAHLPPRVAAAGAVGLAALVMLGIGLAARTGPAPGRTAAGAGSQQTFPVSVGGAAVLSTGDALELVAAGLPAGAALAVAGWLDASTRVLTCTPDLRGERWPADAGRAFCWRSRVLRGPPDAPRAIYLQVPAGTPPLAEDAATAAGGPVPVVALLESGSPRATPCWPGPAWCGRELTLERLLWVDGRAVGFPVATLAAQDGKPNLDPARVASLAARGPGGRTGIVAVIGLPAALRDRVAPGAGSLPIEGPYAWIVRVRGPGAAKADRLDRLWWVLMDDATAQPSSWFGPA